jgi:hypothetical protein
MVKAAVDWWNGQTTAAMQAAQEAATQAGAQAEAALKQEWGAAYEPRLREIGRMMTELGGAELQAELDRSGMGNNPLLMKALGKILDKTVEPGALTNGQANTGLMTPGQAKAARLTLENDPIKSAALFDPTHSMHAAVVEERKRYFALESGQAT